MNDELIKYLGGGGAVLFFALAWKFSKMWRKDDEDMKKELNTTINKFTGRIDCDIKALQAEDKLLHKRISDNKDEIHGKLDAEVHALTKAVTESSQRTNETLTQIIGKLSKIEGKLDIN